MSNIYLLQGSILLAACAALAGCGITAHSNLTTSPSPLPAADYTNWQIQWGTSITSPQNVSPFLAGAMQIQGTQVTGTFQTSSVCLVPTQPLIYTGTFDSTTGALDLQPTPVPYVHVNLVVPSNPTNLSVGTINGSGNTCALDVNGPGVGIEIPTLTGTFTGPISSGTSTAGGAATLTLTLTQSTIPNTQAAFPLTATLQYTSTACSASYALSGSISGAMYSLTSAAAGPTVSGLDSDGGATLPSVTFNFPTGPCGSASAATFTGTLTQ